MAQRIVDAIEQLSTDPFRPRPGLDIRKLKGQHPTARRIRVGPYRIIYETVRDERAVYVTKIVRRGQAYR